jgi:hypothetical protein
LQYELTYEQIREQTEISPTFSSRERGEEWEGERSDWHSRRRECLNRWLWTVGGESVEADGGCWRARDCRPRGQPGLLLLLLLLLLVLLL